MKLVQACFQYKSTLFSTGERGKVYRLVTDDLNKYHDSLFFGMLKENTVRDVWNKAVTDSEAQQEDKKNRHHLWFNGSQLREMSAWETLLDEIYVEKKAFNEKKQAAAEQEQEEERDKRARLSAAFERVEARYSRCVDSNEDGSGLESSPEKSPDDGVDGESKKAKNGSYGRGTKKGNQQRAGQNSGLSPDAKQDRLAQACDAQAQIAKEVQGLVSDLGKRETKEPSDFEKEQLKIQKLTATAQLMETYLKFALAGVEMPEIFKEALQKGV